MVALKMLIALALILSAISGAVLAQQPNPAGVVGFIIGGIVAITVISWLIGKSDKWR